MVKFAFKGLELFGIIITTRKIIKAMPITFTNDDVVFIAKCLAKAKKEESK